MSGELFGYARVSKTDQNLDRQIDLLREHGVQEDHLVVDKFSGSTLARPAFEELRKRLRTGDTVITESLSRLSRTTKDLLKVIEEWQAKGITYMSIKESLDFSTSTGKLILSVMASISEFERNVIRERVMEGLVSARARGRVGGRKPTDAKKVQMAIQLYESKNHTLAEIRELTTVSESALYRALRKRKISDN
jgi:DNA invertase Pin-like site-specific DNA recombinase